MVRICSVKEYPEELEEKYAEQFSVFPYELSPFQKWSIQAIVEGHHVLACAHTGSGKTLPAEFAIYHFCRERHQPLSEEHQPNKRVIYCSPIKALSNQKFNDFTTHELFVENGISVGLITGDNKINPDADVLIMTTEILLNKLYGHYVYCCGDAEETKDAGLSFDLDIGRDVACVIFDEVHYINDKDRGHVWEETIMTLPTHIQLVMLSATLEAPEKFAKWCESRDIANGDTIEGSLSKEVFMTATHERIVPLIHYSFITATSTLLKLYGKDDEVERTLEDTLNKLHVIQTSQGEFKEPVVDAIKRVRRLFDVKNYTTSRKHVLNQVCRLMKDNAMFPAICFVYSRRAVEDMAQQIETTLYGEDEEHNPTAIAAACEAILRQRLGNWREYCELAEYRFIVGLLERGVAIHHAGMMPVFREMVELAFSMGFVKLLFATETFSVGINMPTKTVLFTSLSKYDGSGLRDLLPHEYSQQSGRAGRRGKDVIGHVIHLCNLWDTNRYSNTALRGIMCGTAQRLESKFSVTYSMILNFIASQSASQHTGSTSQQIIEAFISKSMYQDVVDAQVQRNTATALALSCKNTAKYNTPEADLKRWIELDESAQYASHKKKKAIEKERIEIKTRATNKDLFLNDLEKYKAVMQTNSALATLEADTRAAQQYMSGQVQKSIALLIKWGYIICSNDELQLTQKGYAARFMREISPIVFTTWFLYNGTGHQMRDWTASDIAAFFSIFTSVASAGEDIVDVSTMDIVKDVVKDAIKGSQSADTIKGSQSGSRLDVVMDSINAYRRVAVYFKDEELTAGIHRNSRDVEADAAIHTRLVGAIRQWCDSGDDKVACSCIIYELEQSGVALGEFVKAILKIVNLCAEMEQVANYLGDYALLATLKTVPGMMLKYVCSAQSLYI